MKNLIYLSLIFIIFPVHAQKLRVSVFNSIPVQALSVNSIESEYTIYNGDEKVSEGNIFYISLYNRGILLSNRNGSLGSYDQLVAKAKSNNSKLQISVVDPKAGTRTYTGDVLFRVEYGRILIINETDVESYISGVVEAEAGINALPEFQKAQALLCRTYLYSNLSRHETEGFNLCDEVHCQAFHGVTAYSGFIYKATSQTRGKVIVAHDTSLITATFHGNCGGETQTSDNTWLKGHEYLVTVKDPYCKGSRNNNWEKTIPLTDWKKYLDKNGVNSGKLALAAMEMKKPGRQLNYVVGKKSIPTQQIRTDWNLKSSFFQVVVQNNSAILKGHGYGHGVGMCQDGAMKMATLGKSCEDIILFYYKGVKIVPYSKL